MSVTNTSTNTRARAHFELALTIGLAFGAIGLMLAGADFWRSRLSASAASLPTPTASQSLDSSSLLGEFRQAFGQTQRQIPAQFQEIGGVLGLVFRTTIAASGTIFVLFLLIGGVRYLTSSGNEEATGAAKKVIISAIIGLLITLSAWAIGIWILKTLKLIN